MEMDSCFGSDSSEVQTFVEAPTKWTPVNSVLNTLQFSKFRGCRIKNEAL